MSGRLPGSHASSSQSNVLPVRSIPTTTIGSRTCSSRTSGCALTQAVSCSRFTSRSWIQRAQDHAADVVELGLVRDRVEQHVEPLAPRGIPEIVEAGLGRGLAHHLVDGHHVASRVELRPARWRSGG